MGYTTKTSMVALQRLGMGFIYGHRHLNTEPIQEKQIAAYPRLEKTTEVDGLKISYFEAGNPDHPLLLLVHGIASNKKVWQRSIDGGELSKSEPAFAASMKMLHRKQYRQEVNSLSRNFRVIAPDLPGFGQSVKPERVTHEYLVGSFMPKFVKSLGIDKMHLAGISMGGAVALGYSIRNPETIASLHLMCPFGLEPYGLGPIAMLALRNTTISKTGISIATSDKFGKQITKLYSFLGALGQGSNSNMRSIISYMAAMDDSSLEWLSDQVHDSIFKILKGSPMKTDYSSDLPLLSEKIKHITLYHDPKDPIIPFRNTLNAYEKLKAGGNAEPKLVGMYGVGHQLYMNPGYLNERMLETISALSRSAMEETSTPPAPKKNLAQKLIARINGMFAVKENS